MAHTARTLAVFLAVILTTACASFHRQPVPGWQRYREGALAGFLEAPGEGSVENVAGAVVRRVRGQITINDDERDPLQVHHYHVPRPRATFHGPDGEPGGTEQLVDALVFVVELRGPGTGQEVRTLASRDGLFDFGPLPKGTYTLKATVLGWRSAVGQITVSDSADPAARITMTLNETR